MRREKTSLPVDVRRSKTSLLKFPILNALVCYEKLYCVTFKRDILEGSREFVVCFF